MEKRTNRSNKQLRELMQWINSRLEFVEQIIDEAEACHNYGKETEYRGMKNAYKECLRRLGHSAV